MIRLESENIRPKVSAKTYFKENNVQCWYVKENEKKTNQLWFIFSNALK